MTSLPLSDLPDEEKSRRAGSFGDVAEHYENFRPGPPKSAIEWMLGGRVSAAVDLGAGTGACTRLLLGYADEVTAVEPDDQMRAVLTTAVPGATALKGKGEAIPLPDGSADAVIASSSWHWMDQLPTLREVARVLKPGGTLGCVWTGPDPDGAFITQARALLDTATPPPDADSDTSVTDLVMNDAGRPASVLSIPDDGSVPFTQPAFETFRWELPRTADDLIGLLGTFSWVILMEEATRQHLLSEARRLLRELLGIEGDVTVDVTYRADAWRATRR
ncbi:MAG TPA: class I SAM-dependent methyltransferase [Acidimicrobiales bacterium]